MIEPFVAAQSQPPPVSVLKKLPHLLCGVLLALYSLFFLYRAGIALLYPYPLEYGEGAVLQEARQLFLGGFQPSSLYPSNTHPPYLASNYTPLYYYLQALLMPFTGSRSFLGGRLLSIVAWLCLAGVLYQVGRAYPLTDRPTGRLIGLAVALTPFATNAVYAWSVLNKPDNLGLAFSLGAVACLWWAEPTSEAGDPARRTLVVTALLCLLALLTKQSFLAAPAAISLWLVLQRRWSALKIFLTTLALSGGSVACLFYLTGGSPVLTHLLSYNAQVFSVELLLKNLNYFITNHPVLLVLSVVWLVRPSFDRTARFDLWRCYYLAALLVSLYAGKSGSAFNVYIECLALAALLAWWQIGYWWANRSVGKWWLGPVGLVLMALQLALLHHVPGLADAVNTPGSAEFEQSRQAVKYLQARTGGQPAWSVDCGWQLLAGSDCELDDYYIFDQAARNGYWNSQPFVDKLNNGYYRFIFFEYVPIYVDEATLEQVETLLRADYFQPTGTEGESQLLSALNDRQKFRLDRRIGRWFVLMWRG